MRHSRELAYTAIAFLAYFIPAYGIFDALWRDNPLKAIAYGVGVFIGTYILGKALVDKK